ncbi:MAG: GAF domain-containing protein [Actinomycetota bacterium]
MLKEAFCASCVRTVYRGVADEDSCPVCSSPLVVTGSPRDVEVAAPPPGPLIPENESLRLAAVGRYEILDTPRDGAFDRITELAARVFQVPIATITIVDHDRIWFKSKYGIDAEQIDREPGLCASAVLSDEAWVVSDAAIDPRSLDNPLVRGELGLRFYAGAPLRTADGYSLGTINIIDTKPRELTEEQVQILQGMAEIVVDNLELRLAALRLYRDAREGRLDARTN